MTPPRLPQFRPDKLLQPLLAFFPHGLQHGARRNAYHAMGLTAAGRRDRLAADAAVTSALAAQTAPVAARS